MANFQGGRTQEVGGGRRGGREKGKRRDPRAEEEEEELDRASFFDHSSYFSHSDGSKSNEYGLPSTLRYTPDTCYAPN